MDGKNNESWCDSGYSLSIYCCANPRIKEMVEEGYFENLGVKPEEMIEEKKEIITVLPPEEKQEKPREKSAEKINLRATAPVEIKKPVKPPASDVVPVVKKPTRVLEEDIEFFRMETPKKNPATSQLFALNKKQNPPPANSNMKRVPSLLDVDEGWEDVPRLDQRLTKLSEVEGTFWKKPQEEAPKAGPNLRSRTVLPPLKSRSK